jgi:activator of HSP90 ATPase
VKRETRTIKQTESIPAKPIDVYMALIDGKKHSDFTGSKATSNPKVGGKFTAWDGYISGKHLKLEKARRIIQEWKTTEWPSGYPPSRVEFTLKEIEGGTELTMVHSDVPGEQVDSYRQGWTDFYWKPIKQYFKNKRRAEANASD